MNIRHIMGILIICLMLQYSMGGLCATTILSNDSQGVNNGITVSENTTRNMINATAANTVNNTTSNYIKYPLNCPKWDDYKDAYVSPITSFREYWSDLKKYVINFQNTDDYNVGVSKAKYDNNTGYFSGNPIGGDIDYRYMPTSELNEAYTSASIAKSRIALPNSLSTSLQATYTIVAIVLGIVSGILSVITTVAGILTAASGGGASPILIACVTLTSLVVATTIAIGTCTGIITRTSSGINEENAKIDTRLIMMNAELTYRSTLPVKCGANMTNTTIAASNVTNVTGNNSELNKTLNNTTKLNTSTDINLNSLTTLKKGTKQSSAVKSNQTNAKNTTQSTNIIGLNDVPPSTEPIPGNVTTTRSGTYLDEIYNIDVSGLPQEPSKPHPKWYQFWKWIEYGAQYVEWTGKVMAWGFNHMETFKTVIGMSKHIIADSNS